MPGLSLDEFSDRVNEILPEISREFLRHQTTEFYKVRMTFPQFIIMDILYRHRESKMTDLARLTNVTTAAVTGLVERLVRDGYAKRQRDTKDRRIIKAGLTAKGDRVARKMIEFRKKMTSDIFGMITQDERDEYLKILEHIRKHLRSEEHII